MRKPPFTGTLARTCARRPWLVVGVWVVLLALASVSATGLGEVLTAGEMEFVNRPESVQGAQLLEQRMRGPEPQGETVIVRSLDLTADDPGFRRVVDGVVGELTALEGSVESAVSYYQVHTFAPEAAGAMLSSDGHTVLVSVTLNGDDGSEMEAFHAVLDAPREQGFQVLSVGDETAEETFMSTAEEDLRVAEMYGLPITLGVLIVVFGALVAAGLSLLLALVAVVVAVGLAALIGKVFALSFFVVNMIAMIGLAVGVDYALFIIERYREERVRGAARREAIGLAGDTASKAVLFSGGTVMLALLGLFLIPITTFRSLGVGALLVVGVAVLAMLTLVPALLSLLGDRIDWPGIRKRGRRSGRVEGDPNSFAYSGFWGRVAKGVMARPVLSVTVAGAMLLAAALPAMDLVIGASGAESLPSGQAREAYEIMAEEFSAGMVDPIEIVVDGKKDLGTEGSLTRLVGLVAQDRDYAPGGRVTWNEEGNLALVSVAPAGNGEGETAGRAVRRLREEIIPAAFGATAGSVYVTGGPALALDSRQEIIESTPLVFAFVLGLSFLLLLLVFRSLIVPIKAILMNLLSVGAAYGMLVLVFQKGWGHEILGFQHTPAIEPWVPVFLFCILFGLSMDYHVFLLSRIREHFNETGRNEESVAMGLRKTGRIITGAALIMVVIFSTFAAGRLVMVQQVGFGLAMAVLLDATIVRMVMVPASMALLGRLNWYLPSWLDWLPRVNI